MARGQGNMASSSEEEESDDTGKYLKHSLTLMLLVANLANTE